MRQHQRQRLAERGRSAGHGPPDRREKWIGGLHIPQAMQAEEPGAGGARPSPRPARWSAPARPPSAALPGGLESAAGKVAMVVTEQGDRTGCVPPAGVLQADLPGVSRNRPAWTSCAPSRCARRRPRSRPRRHGTPYFSIRRRLDGGYSLAQNGVGFEDHPGCLPLHARLLGGPEHRHRTFASAAPPGPGGRGIGVLDRPSPF